MVYAMATLVGVIYAIGFFTAYIRVSSVKSGKVRAGYFKLMQKKEGTEIPEIITKTTRQFNNMFEVPMLFFVAGTLHIVLNTESALSLAFAWAFVAARIVQAIIHLTYNIPIHRMIAFMAGNICVIGMWCTLIANA